MVVPPLPLRAECHLKRIQGCTPPLNRLIGALVDLDFAALPSFFACAIIAIVWAQAGEGKRVLVLYREEMDSPAHELTGRGIGTA